MSSVMNDEKRVKKIKFQLIEKAEQIFSYLDSTGIKHLDSQ